MRTDILLDADFDLLLDDNGHLTTGESDQQHVELLVMLQKGELKQFPFVGFGIERRLKAVQNPQRFTRELRVELEADGYTSPELDVKPDLSVFKISI